ncbi:hypothetical protein NMY22_g7731 [Coprinellus aureogranulatus]|nr:hypothetical protein NMY22_g7731 [Coprinellus aureogranulatus]
MRQLGEFLTPGNATVDILRIVFDSLAKYPVIISRSRSSFLARTIAGAGVCACLSAIWKLTGNISNLSPEVTKSLMMQLQELQDSVFGWTRVCLQHGIPYIPEAVIAKAQPSRLDMYLSQARMLRHILTVNEDFSASMLSSPSFVNLFLELWTAELGVSGDVLAYRMVDNASDEPCPIVTLFAKIVCGSHSREILFAQCNQAAQSDEFCLALTDRFSRGWEGKSISFVGWICSLDQLVLATFALCNSSRRLRKRLTRYSYLMQISSELEAYAESVTKEPDLRNLLAPAMNPLLTLAQLALGDDTHSRISTNWRELQSGQYMEALFTATAGIMDEQDRNVKHLLAILTKLGEFMVYPRESGRGSISEFDIGKLAHLPKIARSWGFLIDAHGRAAVAYESLQARPLVYFCDYLPCSSVVYCSDECQKKDWEGLHRHECRHVRTIHAGAWTGSLIAVFLLSHEIIERRSSHTWYDHDIRASQAALLEVIYEEDSDDEHYDSNTFYPVYDYSFMDGLDQGSYIDDIEDNTYWDDSFPKTYLRPRLDALMKAYRDREVPSVGGSRMPCSTMGRIVHSFSCPAQRMCRRLQSCILRPSLQVSSL